MVNRASLWCQAVLVLLTQGVLASLKNFTIDDANDSVQYSGNWQTDCPKDLKGICINPSKVYNKTVHWNWPSDPPGGSPASITVRFSGTAVYVYNVLASIPVSLSSPKVPVAANIAFTLDDISVGTYEQSPGSNDLKYLYHQLVYMNDSLSDGAHELIIIGGKSLVLFDFIDYTSEQSDGLPPAVSPISPPSTAPSSSLIGPPTTSTLKSTPTPMSMPMSMFTVGTSPHTTISRFLSSDSRVPTAIDTTMLTTTDTTAETATATATASSREGSNRSAAAIAGGVVGSVLALLLLGVITLFVRRRLSARRVGKGMGRLLDEGPSPRTDNADHFTSNRGQFLSPMYPPIRATPDVPRSPGYTYTMSSMPTSPTSYGGEPPSRTYMDGGTVARILEKADRARTEWPSSTGTSSRAFPAALGTMERW